VSAAKAEMARKFDASRRSYNKPVCQELLSESFFVFALSAYGRLVCEYTDMLCDNPPLGDSFGTVVTNSLKGMFKFPSVHHDRFLVRYWLGLMLCFDFSVFMDGYGGACAVTAVFLINTRVGPDMMATLNTLLAVVVGAVVGAILFSYSCMTGMGTVILPLATFIYWVITIHIGYSGSSFALIGLFMAALAPFSVVKMCPDELGSGTGGAAGLWAFIRGCIMAMTILTVCEFGSVPGQQGELAAKQFDDAMHALKEAFTELFEEQDPSVAVAPVGGFLAAAANFNSGAKLEPRGWKCKWKSGFMDECITVATKLRLDLLTIKHALDGSGNVEENLFASLNKVPAIKHMAEDLEKTMEDARELAMDLLLHGYGPFSGTSKLDSMEGIDQLDGFEKSIGDMSGLEKFPTTAPESMEDDKLCKLSVIFVMLDYSIKHVADIIKAAIRHQ